MHYQELYLHLLYLQNECVLILDKDLLSQTIIKSLNAKIQSMKSKTGTSLEDLEKDPLLIEPLNLEEGPPMGVIKEDQNPFTKRKLKSQHDYDELLDIQSLNIASFNKLQSEVFGYKQTITRMEEKIDLQSTLLLKLENELDNEKKINVLLNGSYSYF